MAFASLEGLPDMRADFGFGQVCATLANVHRREGQDAYQADDFMPGLRTPLFFATGSYHVPFWKFFMLDGIAALISVPLWVYVGFLFGENLEELEQVMRNAQVGIYAGLGLIIVLFAGAYVLKKRLLRVE